jgi:hypothetical protein
MPTKKLESKVKVGSKEIKKYDEPRSPYQRLLESEALPPEVQAELTRLYGLYNSVQLQHTANKAILALREAVAVQSPSFRKESGGLKLHFKMRHFGSGQKPNQRLKGPGKEAEF